MRKIKRSCRPTTSLTALNSVILQVHSYNVLNPINGTIMSCGFTVQFFEDAFMPMAMPRPKLCAIPSDSENCAKSTIDLHRE